jgi:hypothetical protein
MQGMRKKRGDEALYCPAALSFLLAPIAYFWRSRNFFAIALSFGSGPSISG